MDGWSDGSVAAFQRATRDATRAHAGANDTPVISV